MVANITYTKTTRGQSAFIKGLPDAVGQVLTAMDGDLTEEQILAKLHDVSEHAFREAMTWLLEGGFIRLTDSEPFSFSEPNAVANDAIQVQEISFDEFDALSGPGLSNERRKEIAAESELAFNIFAQAAEKSAKSKKKTKAEKEKARLEAIETTKRIIAAKAEELAKLNSETEMQKQADVLAKKEVWARLKTEADDRASAEKKANEEAAEKARAQAERQEKERNEAEEEAGIADVAAGKEQITLQRLAKKAQSKNLLKRWLKDLLSIIKSLFTFAFVMLCLMIVAGHFVNIPMLANTVEKIAAEKIQDKVNIKSAHVWLFPRPHILLNNVTVTDTNPITAEKIRIYPNLTSLKPRLVNALTATDNKAYEIQSIKIEALSIAQKDFAHLHKWSAAIASNQQTIVHHLVFENLALKLNALNLPPLHADVALDSTDVFKKAVITTKGKDFNLTIHAVNGDYLMDIAAANWRAPVSPYPLFTSLNATGVIKNDDLTFSSIIGQLCDGKLNGQLQTNLASARLITKGGFKLKEMTISKLANDLNLNPTVTGTLNSNANFSFNVNQSNNEINSPTIDATFSVQKGVLNKIDIAEAMRTKNINGSTNFTTLAGSASLKNNRYQFNHLFLQDKQLQAYGQVTISADRQVSATISSRIAIPDNPITRDLIIKGSVNTLKLIN